MTDHMGERAREIARRFVADFRPGGWPAKEEEIARYIAGQLTSACEEALREAGDMAAFSASEAAGYLYPDSLELRQAFCTGAAHVGVSATSAREEAVKPLVEALREVSDKLNIARLDSRDDAFRKAAQYALNMADAALREAQS